MLDCELVFSFCFDLVLHNLKCAIRPEVMVCSLTGRKIPQTTGMFTDVDTFMAEVGAILW